MMYNLKNNINLLNFDIQNESKFKRCSDTRYYANLVAFPYIHKPHSQQQQKL